MCAHRLGSGGGGVRSALRHRPAGSVRFRSKSIYPEQANREGWGGISSTLTTPMQDAFIRVVVFHPSKRRLAEAVGRRRIT